MQRHTQRACATQATALFGLTALVVLAMIGMAGCSSETTEEAAPAPEATPETAAPEAAAETAPRIFFMEPQDGATVSSPVQMEFGAENFVIEPVGDGAIHAGAGHYHIGVDTDCLAPGEIIPEASPWIHFGDGSSKIEVQLEPGTHRLCLQIGDGEHRTLEGEGMSAEITVTVQ